MPESARGVSACKCRELKPRQQCLPVSHAVCGWLQEDTGTACTTITDSPSMQGCVYNAVALASGGRSLFAAGSDKKLRELEDAVGSGTQVAVEVDCGCCITQLAVPSSAPNCAA